MSVTAPEQTAEVQVQQAAPAAPAPVAPIVTTGSGPWDTDLQLAFPDPGVRAQVDNFLRGKVQPYTTQLEQQAAASKDAVSLWNDIRENTDNTFAAIAGEIYGEEARDEILSVVQAKQAAAQPGATTAQVVAADQQQAALPPELQEMVTDWQTKKNQDAYEAQIAAVTATNPDINPQHLHPFVVTAEGDVQKAVGLYRAFMADLPQATPVDPAVPAPPVMGSDAGQAAPSSTPQVPPKQTLDQALNDFMAEQRVNRQAPPVV